MLSSSANFLCRKLAHGAARNSRSGPLTSRSSSIATVSVTKFRSGLKVRSSLWLSFSGLPFPPRAHFDDENNSQTCTEFYN